MRTVDSTGEYYVAQVGTPNYPADYGLPDNTVVSNITPWLLLLLVVIFVIGYFVFNYNKKPARSTNGKSLFSSLFDRFERWKTQRKKAREMMAAEALKAQMDAEQYAEELVDAPQLVEDYTIRFATVYPRPKPKNMGEMSPREIFEQVAQFLLSSDTYGLKMKVAKENLAAEVESLKKVIEACKATIATQEAELELLRSKPVEKGSNPRDKAAGSTKSS